MPFEVQVERLGATARVILAGELDLTGKEAFTRALAEAGEEASLVVVDLRRLDFMDSTGVHCILRANIESQRNGHRLAVIRGPEQVQRAFEVTCTEDSLPIVDDDLMPA